MLSAGFTMVVFLSFLYIGIVHVCWDHTNFMLGFLFWDFFLCMMGFIRKPVFEGRMSDH